MEEKYNLSENELGSVNAGVAEWVVVLVQLMGMEVLEIIKEQGYPALKKIALEKYGHKWFVDAIPA